VTPRPIRQAERSVFNITHPVNAAQNKIINAAIGPPVRYAPRRSPRPHIAPAGSVPGVAAHVATDTQDSQHAELLYEAIRNLGDSPNAAARSRLVAAAEHEDPVMRKLGIRGLARLGDAADTWLLAAALSDPSADVRVEAAHGAEHLVAEDLREPLTKALDDPNELVRDCAAHALAVLDGIEDDSDANASPSLIVEAGTLDLGADDPADLALALRVAACHGELEMTVRELLEVFGRKRLTDAAVDDIEDVLDEAGLRSDPIPRKLELDSRVRLIRESVIPEFALRAHVDDSGPWTMSVDDLLRAFDRSKLTPRARTEIVEALDYAGLDTEPSLAGAEHGQRITIKRFVQTALETTDPAPPVGGVAEEPSRTVTLAGPADVKQRLVAALSDSDSDVRYEALGALEDHLDPGLASVLAPLLGDSDQYVRRLALRYYATLAPAHNKA
jgi:HEAT repeat protein